MPATDTGVVIEVCCLESTGVVKKSTGVVKESTGVVKESTGVVNESKKLFHS